jgi:RNA polymerase sigma factor (sigma-70 family)
MQEEEPRNLVFEKRAQEFGKIYRENVEGIYSYFFYTIKLDYFLAEDLTAQAMFRAFDSYLNREEKIKPIAGIENPYRPWLYKIARNTLINYYRDSQKLGKYHQPQSLDRMIDAHSEQAHFESLFQTLPSLEEEVIRLEEEAIQAEESKRLLDAIQGLNYERQELLVLKFTSSLSNREIGEIMDGRSEGAIKSLYFRTLERLREILKE